ncbi:MAG: hypothetical protein FJ098_14155, partial [Deltaproteobacteria bacterium]|nr:hypothetical protein [Deltaproteobacteria bacterium]
MAPTVNVALHLRLARILGTCSPQAPGSLSPEAQQCLAMLDGLVLALEEKVELLRIPAVQEVPAGEPVVIEAEDVTPTRVMAAAEIAEALAQARPAEAALEAEALPQPAPPEPAAPAEAAPSELLAWGLLHDLLYEDILWLFKMGDNEGALNSLARLMDLGRGTEEIDRFVTINQARLFELFHRVVGPPGAMVERAGGADLGDRYFFRREEAEALLENIGTDTRIEDLLGAGALGDLQQYARL